MAEYITMEQADEKFGSKGKANAGLTLGIIGTALGALAGGGNGILGGMFNGGNSNVCAGPTAWEAWQKECKDNVDLTNAIWQTRVTDLNEKFDLYTRLNARIVELEKKDAQLEAALPLQFQLSTCQSERYTDNRVAHDRERQSAINSALQTEIMMRPVGKVGLPFTDLITGIPQLPKVVYDVTNCGCGCSSTGA